VATIVSELIRVAQGAAGGLPICQGGNDDCNWIPYNVPSLGDKGEYGRQI
jgi:hypothetical protein